MTYADEMSLGALESQSEMGEFFTYNGGVEQFKGLFSDEDPNMTFLAAGKQTQRALICDATSAQFTTAPVAGKKLVYSGDGKTYMIRLVHPITGGLLRLHIYLL